VSGFNITIIIFFYHFFSSIFRGMWEFWVFLLELYFLFYWLDFRLLLFVRRVWELRLILRLFHEDK
jgi:hypothetical protein